MKAWKRINKTDRKKKVRELKMLRSIDYHEAFSHMYARTLDHSIFHEIWNQVKSRKVLTLK